MNQFFSPTPNQPLSSSLPGISGRSRAVDDDSGREMRGCVAAMAGFLLSMPQSLLRDPQLQQQRATELEPRGRTEIWNRSTVKTPNWFFYNSIFLSRLRMISHHFNYHTVFLMVSKGFFSWKISFPFCFLCLRIYCLCFSLFWLDCRGQPYKRKCL